MYKKIVIEGIKDLIYLKFVATEFFPKVISPSADETLVTQRSPCYSAVPALLTNPLPDRSNYSPLLPHLYLTPDQYINSLYGTNLLPSRSAGNYTSLLQRFTAESRRELRRNIVP